MQVNPINTKKTYQFIVEQIIQLITEDKLSAGQKLPPERTLADMFNVSRASIREAFRAMEIIGLIEVRPGEGTFITDLNIAPFINTIAPLFVRNDNMENELLEFRKMIEREAVKLAAEKITHDKLPLLEEAIDLMRQSIEQSNPDLGAEADIRFHKAIFAVTGNFILIKAAEFIAYIVESSVKFNREKILKDVNNSRELLKQHIMIYDAIKSNDGDKAVAIMNRHLSFVQEIA